MKSREQSIPATDARGTHVASVARSVGRRELSQGQAAAEYLLVMTLVVLAIVWLTVVVTFSPWGVGRAG